MKKLAVAVALALLATSVACAADITLKDGRLLREAVVIKQDAATVTFRHSAGFSQIEKIKLPETLLAAYPLDASQVKLEAEQQRQEMMARRAEAERLHTLRLQLAAAAPKPAEVPATVEPQPSADSPTWSNSWVDTYNAESWRLMRQRDRQYRRDRDYVRARHHDQGRDRQSGYENRRGPECPPTGSRPSTVNHVATNITMTPGVTIVPDVHMVPDVRMVPDVHMTPNITRTSLDQRTDAEVPPTDPTKRWTQVRRF